MRRYALRDDQWERIRDLLPGREGYVGGQLRITAYLSMLSCIDIELGYLGGTYPSDLGT